MAAEIWRDIPGYEGAYQVSSLGRVRSLDRVVSFVTSKGSTGQRILKGRVLCKTRNNKSDRLSYEHVSLCRDGRSQSYEVQVLVALAFIGPRCERDEQIRHLDGDPTNNRVSNLMYGTRSENQLDTYAYRGRHHRLTPKDAKEIRERRAAGETGRSLSKEFGCSESNINEIVHGRSFAWLE